MRDTAYKAIAIVGVGAVLPDAPDAPTFWRNVQDGRYSISETPAGRWDSALYWDPDPKTPDKSYSKIGGWVRDWTWDPIGWKLPVPPKVGDSMDRTQKWAVAATREALADYGWPARALDPDRTAVILGNAMAGERHYQTALRLSFPEIARELSSTPSFAGLSADLRRTITGELHAGLDHLLPEVDEDTMPGELSNIIAGRVANLFNFHGPNFVVDAACASAMAALGAAIEGLDEEDFDAVITGGIDANMGAATFIKFCKIGALSATGTRPYADGADGFVMGEGAAVFVLKRLADAERDGDRIYAVIRGVGGSSDGRGKGITAPNPAGQRLAVQRAWRNAGVSPATVGLIEGHGTSTKVGDAAELESLQAVFGEMGLPPKSVALGSVKSNIGHLKGAAGAAGILKAAFALRDKVLPPSLNCGRPNPNIDFSRTPFYLNTELRPWDAPAGGVRRAGVSAFGFGGTNFHAVLEEHIPGRLDKERKARAAVEIPRAAPVHIQASAEPRQPIRGAALVGAATAAELGRRLEALRDDARSGRVPPPAPPLAADLAAPLRLAVDYGDAAELAVKTEKVLRALAAGQTGMWRALRSQGIFRGAGPAPKVAFVYTGQGSQYLGMLDGLRKIEPIVAETFAEADRVMEPILGRPLTSYLYGVSGEAAEEELRQTAITQPAVLAADIAITRLLASFGIAPDLVMGHSLGEYGALVAAGCLSFAAALEAVAARGREMTRLSMADNGRMIAVFAPFEEIEAVLAAVDGYAVIANINSATQAVVGGTTAAVEAAAALFSRAGREVRPLPVSHAFHTEIVAPASEPLKEMLRRLDLRPPRIPVVANATGELYPMGENVVPEMIDLLGRQIASPVQFVRGLHTLYEQGARAFVEVGPKRALHGFVEDVLGRRDGRLDGITALFTNHPKSGDVPSFNHALCGLWAAGLGVGKEKERPVSVTVSRQEDPPMSTDSIVTDSIVIIGAALGLPGSKRVFDDANLGHILRGGQGIDAIPLRLRRAMLEKNVTRLVKSDEGGGPRFETITSAKDVIKLAARAGELDLARDFGLPEDRLAAFDRVTHLAIGAGIDALRDAGIPLVLRYKTTTTGSRLPDRWGLPDDMRDDTGVIFASAFPGYDSLVGQMEHFHRDRTLRERLAELEDLRSRLVSADGAGEEIDRRIRELRAELKRDPFVFDRRFLFQVLSMGHAQLAETIGARGPNTQVNAACASTTQACAIASDWIRTGRCRRVVVVAADDITSDNLLGWFGAGFLASGAAATDELVEDAVLPFDRRRHGLVIGMGAAAIVIEAAEAVRERGLRPICELLGTVVANSAFHGSRLDVHHIADVMEKLVAGAEARWGLDRQRMAPEMVFFSHETYTPARGGSAQAEVEALRRVFGAAADKVVVANTKGFTGHPMAVGIEDVVAVKALETGLVPPVPNVKEMDPELGALTLSRGGAYPVRYALRLGAGFGSQVSMSLLRWVPNPDGERRAPEDLGYQYRIADPAVWNGWLARVSGQEDAEVEVVQRTLRVVDRGMAKPEKLEKQVVVSVSTGREVAPSPAPAGEGRGGGSIPVTTTDSVKERVLSVIAEKTGYPIEMLALDLDMEADLGIDTVKQAETFAAIRAAYDIPREENLKLRDFPTLAHTIQFVYDRRPDLAAEKTPSPTLPRLAGEGATAQPVPAEKMVATTAEDPVKERVLALIAEKTGYPVEMLDLDLDMEADLGIDTVKQAETFAAIRAAYDIPREENLKLRDFPTLAHTIQFVYDRRPDLKAGETPSPTLPRSAGEGATAQPSQPETTPQLEGFPRRVPVPVLRPPIELCKPTGVTLEAGTRVALFSDLGGAGEALAATLSDLGVEVVPIADTPDLEARLRDAGPVQGLYWLPALDVTDTDPKEALRVRAKLLYTTLRALYDSLTFAVSATRLGGRHGYGEAGAFEPLGGAVTGLLKSFSRERPGVLVKAVDFTPDAPAAEIADRLVEETVLDPGAVEIGREGTRRWSVGLAEQDLSTGPGLTLGPDTVFVVTGAAGSIVSAITRDLASHSRGGTFHLLDLAPEPDPADPDLVKYATDRDGLKRDLFERLQAQGERATPARIEKELARLERADAALQGIKAIQQAGGRAVWHRLDLRDTAAVAAALDRVRQENGRVDVLIHAGGLEISRHLPDKSPEEFNLVFDVKVDGWLNLMAGLGGIAGIPLGAAVVFSSIAGRFGNDGQADYSAANDFLCKSVSAFRHTRPDTLGIALDWTAWGGIGMATRGSIPKVMEAAGIDMLPPAIGIPAVRRELTAGTRGEVVVAGRLGVMLEEKDATGGLDLSAEGLHRLHPSGALALRPTGMTLHGGLTLEAALDPKEQPFLDDHRIDGTPVLPGVMGIEAFAEAATLLFPGLRVQAVEDMEFLAPFKLYRDEPRTITVEALFRGEGDEIVADCRLLGYRNLPGAAEPQETVHFRGRVRLAAGVPEPDRRPVPAQDHEGTPAATAEDIYRIYFHGPAYQVLAAAWRDGDGTGAMTGRFATKLPPNHQPADRLSLMEPRLIELCFQTAGIGELGTHGRMALPLRVDRVAVFRPAGDTPLYAVTRNGQDGAVDAVVVDPEGNVYVALSGYRTIELPGGLDPERIAPLRAAVSGLVEVG
jgi:acyl transferase domain-containing protein